MLAIIWKLLGPILVDLALTFGIPKAVELLKKIGAPAWLIDALTKIIKGAIDEIKEAKADQSLPSRMKKAKVRSIKAKAKLDAKRECTGTACSPDTVGE